MGPLSRQQTSLSQFSSLGSVNGALEHNSVSCLTPFFSLHTYLGQFALSFDQVIHTTTDPEHRSRTVPASATNSRNKFLLALTAQTSPSCSTEDFGSRFVPLLDIRSATQAQHCVNSLCNFSTYGLMPIQLSRYRRWPSRSARAP